MIESWILAYFFNANANNIYLIRIRRQAHLSEYKQKYPKKQILEEKCMEQKVNVSKQR